MAAPSALVYDDSNPAQSQDALPSDGEGDRAQNEAVDDAALLVFHSPLYSYIFGMYANEDIENDGIQACTHSPVSSGDADVWDGMLMGYRCFIGRIRFLKILRQHLVSPLFYI